MRAAAILRRCFRLEAIARPGVGSALAPGLWSPRWRAPTRVLSTGRLTDADDDGDEATVERFRRRRKAPASSSTRQAMTDDAYAQGQTPRDPTAAATDQTSSSSSSSSAAAASASASSSASASAGDPVRIEFYWSPESRLVRSAAWLFTVKGVGFAVLSAVLGSREAGRLYDLWVHSQDSALSFASYLDVSTLPAPSFALPVAMGGFAYFALWQLRRTVNRVVLRLTRVVSSSGEEEIEIEHMQLLGTGVRRVPRARCECAKPNALTTHFVTVPEGTWFLLPVDGWHSGDLRYLKSFLWWRYFRDEPIPPPDTELISIDGFGPYRPMQLADPDHPLFATVPFPATEKDVEGTPLVVRDGNVYANFDVAPRLSLEERRPLAMAAALFGNRTPLALGGAAPTRAEDGVKGPGTFGAAFEARARAAHDSVSSLETSRVLREETEEGALVLEARTTAPAHPDASASAGAASSSVVPRDAGQSAGSGST